MESEVRQDHFFLSRCADLGQLAGPRSSPNPKVGAVLVHHNKIIGEGYHKRDGESHAEVYCLASVSAEDKALIPKSTLYISLESCCFYGRTPACTDLILKSGIPSVVIGQIDQTAEVSGTGIKILQDAGIAVKIYPDHLGCRRLAHERNLFVSEKRPYTILKWAQTADGFMAPDVKEDYWISSKLTSRLTHRWRAQTGAILVGAGTVLADDPQLTTRHYPGPDPVRIVLDPRGECTGREKVFDSKSDSPTLWFRPEQDQEASFEETRVKVIPIIDEMDDWVKQIQQELYRRGINQLTVEGGAYTLQLFLESGKVDEIRRITSENKRFGSGMSAPMLDGGLPNHQGKYPSRSSVFKTSRGDRNFRGKFRPAEVSKPRLINSYRIASDFIETFTY
ncbi:MAG: bifunctional diaminohydroxyphosphoribosylaminopyrimidine deaminase/5-amino-6-(5-phosphoribosylamino)uracil reductase RibD [Bacteroidota bacterium]